MVGTTLFPLFRKKRAERQERIVLRKTGKKQRAPLSLDSSPETSSGAWGEPSELEGSIALSPTLRRGKKVDMKDQVIVRERRLDGNQTTTTTTTAGVKSRRLSKMPTMPVESSSSKEPKSPAKDEVVSPIVDEVPPRLGRSYTDSSTISARTSRISVYDYKPLPTPPPAGPLAFSVDDIGRSRQSTPVQTMTYVITNLTEMDDIEISQPGSTTSLITNSNVSSVGEEPIAATALKPTPAPASAPASAPTKSAPAAAAGSAPSGFVRRSKPPSPPASQRRHSKPPSPPGSQRRHSRVASMPPQMSSPALMNNNNTNTPNITNPAPGSNRISMISLKPPHKYIPYRRPLSVAPPAGSPLSNGHRSFSTGSIASLAATGENNTVSGLGISNISNMIPVPNLNHRQSFQAPPGHSRLRSFSSPPGDLISPPGTNPALRQQQPISDAPLSESPPPLIEVTSPSSAGQTPENTPHLGAPPAAYRLPEGITIASPAPPSNRISAFAPPFIPPPLAIAKPVGSGTGSNSKNIASTPSPQITAPPTPVKAPTPLAPVPAPVPTPSTPAPGISAPTSPSPVSAPTPPPAPISAPTPAPVSTPPPPTTSAPLPTASPKPIPQNIPLPPSPPIQTPTPTPSPPPASTSAPEPKPAGPMSIAEAIANASKGPIPAPKPLVPELSIIPESPTPLVTTFTNNNDNNDTASSIFTAKSPTETIGASSFLSSNPNRNSMISLASSCATTKTRRTSAYVESELRRLDAEQKRLEQRKSILIELKRVKEERRKLMYQEKELKKSLTEMDNKESEAEAEKDIEKRRLSRAEREKERERQREREARHKTSNDAVEAAIRNLEASLKETEEKMVNEKKKEKATTREYRSDSETSRPPKSRGSDLAPVSEHQILQLHPDSEPELSTSKPTDTTEKSPQQTQQETFFDSGIESDIQRSDSERQPTSTAKSLNLIIPEKKKAETETEMEMERPETSDSQKLFEPDTPRGYTVADTVDVSDIGF